MLEVADAGVELLDLRRVDIETQDWKADLGETKHQWEAYVSETDDRDRILPSNNSLLQTHMQTGLLHTAMYAFTTESLTPLISRLTCPRLGTAR
jgi:hypothetical protein